MHDVCVEHLAVHCRPWKGCTCIANKVNIETEISTHSYRRGDTVVCCQSEDYESIMPICSERFLQGRANETTVDMFDNLNLTFSRRGPIEKCKTRRFCSKWAFRLQRSMTNMNHFSVSRTPVGEDSLSVVFEMGVVSLPPDRIVKPNLAVDHNQWPRIAHAHSNGFHSTMFRIGRRKIRRSVRQQIGNDRQKAVQFGALIVMRTQEIFTNFWVVENEISIAGVDHFAVGENVATVGASKA